MTANDAGRYQGTELELFQKAVNWKRYFGSKLRPYLCGRIAEVGAGLGANTQILCDERASEWLCLEPDRDMAAHLSQLKNAGALPGSCSVVNGTLSDLSPDQSFDAIVYLDVLEHIEHDSAELAAAAGHLTQSGRLIVLAPAHPWLYTAFDAAIGHFRRYTIATLSAAAPAGLCRESAYYLDSLGVGLSLANKYLLRSSMPSASMVGFWDRAVVPASRWLDRLFGYRMGRSVVVIWRKQTDHAAD